MSFSIRVATKKWTSWTHHLIYVISSLAHSHQCYDQLGLHSHVSNLINGPVKPNHLLDTIKVIALQYWLVPRPGISTQQTPMVQHNLHIHHPILLKVTAKTDLEKLLSHCKENIRCCLVDTDVSTICSPAFAFRPKWTANKSWHKPNAKH